MNVYIFGTGTWGIALAKVLFDNGHQVTCWSKFNEEISLLNRTRKQPNLKDLTLKNIWQIFLLGIPGQTIIILWSNLTSKKTWPPARKRKSQAKENS